MALVLTKQPEVVFAPTNADGTMRGADMLDAMILTKELARGVEGAAAGRVDHVTWAGLSVIVGTRAGQPAQVLGPDAGTHTDPVVGGTVANTGTYIWSTSPVGWRRVGALSRVLVNAINTGLGTANAVEATADVLFDTAAYAALITVNFTATNTLAMTISIGGEPPRDLVTNTGAAIPAGYVKAGMAALIQIDVNGDYRLFSYGDAAAIQAACEAAQLACENARDEAVGAIPDIKFASVAALRLFSVATSALVATTLGYYAAFERLNGGASYDLDVSDTTTADDGVLTIVDAASRRWKLRVDGPLNILKCGVKPGAVAQDTEMTAVITAAATLTTKAIAIPAGTYTFNKEVNWSSLDHVLLIGDSTFDFTGASSAGDFADNAFIYVGGGALVALPDLNANVAKGDSSAVLASAPTLAANDIFCIYDPTNGSYHAGRPEYRKGEWIEALSVSGSTVNFKKTLEDAYVAATVDLYKHPGKRFQIGGGKLTIKEANGATFNTIASVKLTRLRDIDASAFKPTQGAYAGILFDQCVGIRGSGYKVEQTVVGGGGLQYGDVFGGSQDADISGEFFGYRHAITTGGDSGPGYVPNRNILIEGIARNSPVAGAGIAAVNTHGNTENFRFVGTLDGGYSGGGNRIHCEGYFIGKSSQGGVVILLAEMSGCDYTFKGKVYTPGNAGSISRGAVDLGGNATGVLDANTLRGGTLNFDELDIDAPIGQTGIKLVNRGYVGTEAIIISTRGTRMRPSSGSTPHLLSTSINSGNNFDEWHCDGARNEPNNWVITGGSIARIRGWRYSGTVTVTPASTAVNNASQAVTYTRKPPKTAKVVLADPPPTVGGKRYEHAIISPTASGFTMQVLTSDNANFASTAAGDLGWMAFIEE